MPGIEVKVPDIGDFKDVEVIEVLVKLGDAVAKEQSLITLESDKATMEIPSPGGVCLNVGCIPSKALLHTAAVMDAARGLADHGVTFGQPKLDLAKLRAFKDKVVGKLTGGLASMAKMRKVTVVQGVGTFLDKNRLQVEGKDGSKTVRFASAIIAAGSQAAKLPFLPDDPRIVDSTAALELKGVPKKMLVIGGGIIGLEMGTVYSTLGARLDVVEMMEG